LSEEDMLERDREGRDWGCSNGAAWQNLKEGNCSPEENLRLKDETTLSVTKLQQTP